MDERFLTTFAASVEHVCSAMLQLPVQCGLPALGIAQAPIRDVQGTIEVSGAVAGTVGIRLPRATAERLVTLFTGQAPGGDEPGLADAVGELLEMIAGDARRGLGVDDFSLSQPRVEAGLAAREAVPEGGIVIPCRSDCGSFQIELLLQEVARPTAAGRSVQSA